MLVTINNVTLELVEGDITQQDTEAIVNAANSALAGGGGVDGAIHRAAGAKELMAATAKYNGCPTGEAVITPGFKLKAKHVIHTAGPVYRANSEEPPRLLASAYRRSLEVAAENGIESIAFPSISTGVYGYPHEAAAEIALKTAIEYAQTHEQPGLIRFVLFGQTAYQTFERVLARLTAPNSGTE